MSKGEQFATEWRTYTDPISGVPVQQLTNYKGHSHHFYFTNPGWYDNDRKLLFASDRNNRTISTAWNWRRGNHPTDRSGTGALAT
jgi:oligogalacturonide lyase